MNLRPKACSLAAAALFLLAAPAAAQTTTSPGWCVPFVHCDGDWIGDIDRTATGWHLMYGWRSMVDDKLRFWSLSCKHGVCDIGQFIGAMSGFIANKLTKPDDARLAKEAIKPLDCTAEAVLCDERNVRLLKLASDAAILLPTYESIPPAPTPAPTPTPANKWVIKTNPLSKDNPPTRPGFAITCTAPDTCTRGTKELARAAVGTECLPEKPSIKSNEDAWMEVAGKPGIVFLCEDITQL